MLVRKETETEVSLFDTESGDEVVQDKTTGVVRHTFHDLDYRIFADPKTGATWTSSKEAAAGPTGAVAVLAVNQPDDETRVWIEL